MQGIIDMFTLANGQPDLCLIMTWIVLILSIVYNMYLVRDNLWKDDTIKNQDETITELCKQINDLKHNRVYQ